MSHNFASNAVKCARCLPICEALVVGAWQRLLRKKIYRCRHESKKRLWMAKGISWLLINPRGAYGGRHEWAAQCENFLIRWIFHVDSDKNQLLTGLRSKAHSQVIENVWLIRFPSSPHSNAQKLALASSKAYEWVLWMENVVAFASFERNTITTMCALQPKGFPFNIKSIFNGFSFISYKRQSRCGRSSKLHVEEKLTSRLKMAKCSTESCI